MNRMTAVSTLRPTGYVIVALAFFSVTVCDPVALASEAAGKKKADEACVACHGVEGNKPVTPQTPRLAGQHYDYLVQALNDYRKGTRDNPIMSAMAKPLTQEEVRDLALYFSQQEGLTTKR